MPETMIVGSPKHKQYMREQAEALIHDAMEKVSDQGVFSDDQIAALKGALWDVFHAISRTA